MCHAAGLSCLLYHLHKSITIKWGADLSGNVHASSESPGNPINTTNSHLLSLLPIPWHIPLSFHLQDSELLSSPLLCGMPSLVLVSNPGKSNRYPYKEMCTAIKSI